MVESCRKKTRLLVAWQIATEVYSRAVEEQSRQAGIVSKAKYERLSLAAGEARNYAVEAKQILEAHISAHGCDRDGEAAA
jgi:hypothetical protein